MQSGYAARRGPMLMKTPNHRQQAVRRRLAEDVDVKGAGFDVIVKKGAVTLLGRVHDEKAREKAARIVKKVKGVVSVDNQLKLLSET